MNNHGYLGASVAIALLAGGIAAAQERAPAPASAPEPGPAIARAFEDAALAWGPCPDFMPEGCGITVLHGDPARPNADLFFKVPGGAAIARHWHTSAERMVLVSGELQVTYDGQAPVTLRPGMYAYGPPRSPHRANCAPGDACVLFIAFEAPVDAIAAGEGTAAGK